MAYGIIGFGQQNNIWQPSGNIWGDCSSQELLDEGAGFFDYKDFKTRLPQTADGASVTWAANSGSFAWDTGGADSLMKFTTGSTGGNDVAVATRPLGPIVAGSGQKIWFEAYVSAPTVAAGTAIAAGVFVGLVNRSTLGTGLLISGASATPANNTIGTSSGNQSVIGFWLHGDVLNNFDAVYANNLQAAAQPATGSASFIKTVLANVLTANANNPNPANLGYTPPLPPGVLAATGATNTQAQYTTGLVSTLPAFVKLGIRYDGQQYVYFYVNGAQVAKVVVDSTFDQTNDYAGVVEIVAGTNAATILKCGWMRSAAKLF